MGTTWRVTTLAPLGTSRAFATSQSRICGLMTGLLHPSSRSPDSFSSGTQPGGANRNLSRSGAAILVWRHNSRFQPAARLRLFREAADEVPESPRVLHYLVREEWLASAWSDEPGVERAFKDDYLLLRRMAPRLSDALQAETRLEMRNRQR